LETLA